MTPAQLPALLAAIGVLAPGHALYRSRQLWATVDICDTAAHPNTLGIRGSMPSDGHPHDAMFMRFRLQYLDGTSHGWIDLPKGGDSGFEALGAALAARQAGRNFQLVPSAGRRSYTLRGVVTFQWRRGTRVVHSVTRPTSAGHRSIAGADPPGFSAATCTIS